MSTDSQARTTRHPSASHPSPRNGGSTLRRWPPPELPERPYPVLLPYRHPALLAGRDREIAELRRRLSRPVPILGLSSPSGAGKSSLLLGGLVPALREDGTPVAVTRHPHEPDLAERLLADLVLDPGDATTPEAFAERLVEVEELAGAPPVLVLDQFEDVLRRADAAFSRAALGVLLATTVQRRPGHEAPPCRWLLAYRQEAHGDVVAWLGDVLSEAREAGLEAAGDLPWDLATPDRFHAMTLLPLATPSRGSDPRNDAARVFEAAITKPLDLGRYGLGIAPGGARRLAEAFADARLARPSAPLTPELQVVLAHLVERSGGALIEVPEDLGPLIDDALEGHLRRALELVFPARRGRFETPASQSAPPARRARALLALRELAAGDARGRGLPPEALARAIGRDGEEVLAQLAGPLVRLVVLQEETDGWRYVLSHDRLAEVVVRVVEQEGRRSGLVVDSDLLALRRFVTLQSALHQGGALPALLPRRQHRLVTAHADALLWDDGRRAWWDACRRQRRAVFRRRAAWTVLAALVLLAAGLGAARWAERRAAHRALLAQVADGDPETAFRIVAEMTSDPSTDPEQLRASLRQREDLDFVHWGLAGVADGERTAAVLRTVELALPLVETTPEDPVLVASLLWALDHEACREPAVAERAAELWEAVLRPLRRLRPPPPAPSADDPDWAALPGGTFRMGTERDDWGELSPLAEERLERSRPKHDVTLSPFLMLRHEVTGDEIRRLFPEHPGEDDLPARWITWYEAYTYAAWLGGRLPTEAEWEFAAHDGCPHFYCDEQGEEVTVDDVAWTTHNATDPVSGKAFVQPPGRLAANPWGLFDMLGNVMETVSDWYGPYAAGHLVDPRGPVRGEGVIGRSGSFQSKADALQQVFARAGMNPHTTRLSDRGFRVAAPACQSTPPSTTRKPPVMFNPGGRRPR